MIIFVLLGGYSILIGVIPKVTANTLENRQLDS
ncbi:unnamed protein product, partial [Rotaria magnacalcarata]